MLLREPDRSGDRAFSTETPDGLDTTGSAATRVLGLLAVVGLVALAAMSFLVSEPDSELGESVRIMYVHVPTVTCAYLCMVIAALASAWFLRTRSVFSECVAIATGELGVVLLGLTLVTGAIWGRITWGTYWTWDARLTTTALLFLVWAGRAALVSSGDDDSTATWAAVVAVVGALLIPVVSRSVEWWRSLHQERTVLGTLDPKIDGTQLFTLMLGMVVGAVVVAWLAVHRFRVAYLVRQERLVAVDRAVAERRSARS